jgi:hypothetical protein
VPEVAALVAEVFDYEPVGGMNADHIEPLITYCDKAVRRFGSDYDNVAGTGDDLFLLDRHCRLSGVDDACFRVGVLVERWALAGFKVTDEKRNTRFVRFALKLDCGDCPSTLIAAFQNVEHAKPSQGLRSGPAVAPVPPYSPASMQVARSLE